ncbi:MAG: VOC family protein [Acidimicrobiia bacterium]
MQIRSIDISTARHVTDFGSDFRLSPLAAPGARVAVNVIQLPAGGCIGRHRAVVPQTFYVVAGEGWASGDDNARVAVAAGQVAEWSEGEQHAAGSDRGLTAVVLEAAPAQTTAQPVLPQLRYDAPIEAIEWLCRVFGFREETRMSAPNGELYISAVVAPGGGRVMISGPLGETGRAHLRATLPQYLEVAEHPWPNPAYSITMFVPDVDAHYEHARAEGAQILVAPRDQPWGLRDYEVLDLEGRFWNFSQRLRDVEPADWGARRVE